MAEEALVVEGEIADPVQAPEAPQDSDGDIWGDLDSAFDLEYDDDYAPQSEPETVGEEVPQPPAEVAQTPEPTEPPVVETQPVQPVVQEPIAQQPQVTQQVETQWQPPPQPQASPEELAQLRNQFVSQLTDSYKLDEAAAEQLDVNPSAVIPQIAGQLHMRIAESVTQTLGQMLPQLITQQLQYMQAAQNSSQKFFGEWPELNRPEYHQTITQVAQLYKQVKPQATLDQFVKEVGIQAWTALGLPVQQLLTRGQQAAPVSQTVEPIAQGGYAPVTPGASARSQRVSRQSDNPFSQMAEEFLNDDY